MTADEAVRLANADLEAISIALAYDPTAPVIVDGSQFSPSWRALGGGGIVWEADDDVPELAYIETLDAGTDMLGLYWEDGMLVTAAYFDSEEL